MYDPFLTFLPGLKLKSQDLVLDFIATHSIPRSVLTYYAITVLTLYI